MERPRERPPRGDGLADAALMVLWADLERAWSGHGKVPWRVLEEPST